MCRSRCAGAGDHGGSSQFHADYGRIIAYRSAAGFGLRLDGGQGDEGSVITPFYDSLQVKITASGMSFPIALDRMDRALKEFRIRGVQTNIPFIENVIKNETFRTGQASTTLIDTTPELFTFRPRRDRANRLLKYIGDVVVNGNPQAKGFEVKEPFAPIAEPDYNGDQDPPAGTRQILLEQGAEKFATWARKEKRLLITDTTLRDAHQSLFATRMRTEDMLNAADAIARRTPGLFSLEMWGGATFDTAMRFLREDPWQRLRQLREAVPNICFQMLFRGSNAVGYSDYPDNVVKAFVKHSAENGMDIFRIFDSLNYLPNLKAAMQAVRETHAVCEGTICYTGNILDDQRDKYPLEYYVKLAKELEKMGAHTPCIKDMAGLPPVRRTEAGENPAAGGGFADSFPHARHQRRECRFRAQGHRGRRGHCRPGHCVLIRFHQPAESQQRGGRAGSYAARDRFGSRYTE